MSTRRLPAEWEHQDAVLIGWPHAATDWADNLADITASMVRLARAILEQAELLVLAPADLHEGIRAGVGRVAGRLPLCLDLPYDDTWLRDSGPISVRDGTRLTWLDFSFTGWGGKYRAGDDDQVVARLKALPRFAHLGHERHEFALEGGAIDSDGRGTLLSTWNCLSRRHPGRTRAEVEATLSAALGCDRFLWLKAGELAGDDTDAHVDTLARFASPAAIVHQGCADPDDPHRAALQAMATELAAFRDRDGQPYTLFPLPMAPPLHAADGRRLAASYANFLILNEAVLMPAYSVATDEEAAAVLAQAFPGHRIVPVPMRAAIEQNGSLHCLTMQLPNGCLRAEAPT